MIGRRVVVASLMAVAALSCGDSDDVGAPAPSSTTSDRTSTSSPTTGSSSTTSTVPPSSTSTTIAASSCDEEEMLDVVGSALSQARLSASGDWSTDIAGSSYAGRTASGEDLAARVGLDCGFVGTDSTGAADRLLIATWTGPRLGFVVQTDEAPATPYRRDATVTVGIDVTQGEFVDGADRRVWAGTFDSGDTFVVGHVDFSLGAIAKSWVADWPDFPPEPAELPAEQHAIDALEAAGMRLVGIAQPAEFGSEEGTVQFVSPTGQISVADVAPTGWFDPMQPRYYSGPTRIVGVDGVDVRVTEPMSDDNLGFTLASEVGFACDEFAWILEPPGNGSADEMLDSAAAVLATPICRSG